MLKTKKKNIWNNLIINTYLVLPTLIFILGWLKWYYALIFGGLILVAYFKSFSDASDDKFLVFEKGNTKTLLTTLILIVLWVNLSGIGGYCFQNSDHNCRNAIFHALVEYDWPVISNDGRGLIYYIGFWLPAACVGKIFGLEAGYFSQVIWAVLGVFIVYYLICMYRKKVDILPLIFMIFFSGLDYVGTWLLGKDGLDLSTAAHIEWWAGLQFSSTTTQLFWVFNQALPAWIATVLILNQRNCRNMLFILSLIMLSSTFPFVGLIPIVIYLYVMRIKLDKNNWKEILTFQNIVGVVVIGGCVFLYLLGNSSSEAGKASEVAVINNTMTLIQLVPLILRHTLFSYLEFGIYLHFICLYRKNDSLIYVIIAILLLCPFIKVGTGGDFCMRASIPALFILMIICIQIFDKICADKKKYLIITYCIILLIGAITPFNEIHRSIQETIRRTDNGESVRYPEVDIENDLLRGRNFSGSCDNNIFYIYFTK